MLSEDIYRKFAVRSAEVKKADGRTTFECELVSWNGHKVSFHLIIEGCVGAKHFREQYEAISHLCTVGSLLHCSVVYRRRSDAFVMCIDQMMLMKPVRSGDGSEIDIDSYFNPRRGYWVRAVSAGDWINIPGVIELGGQSCIPLVEESDLPLLEHRYGYEKGLHYGKKPSALQRAWSWAFAT